MKHVVLRLAWVVAVGLAVAARVRGQGDLTPPGPPAPTMKSLDQVEPRVPIGPNTTPGDATAIHVITQPGSYYLTGNVLGQPGKSGIVIAADNVTIDLCGYALLGAGTNSVHGIRPLNIRQSAVIRNGRIIGWGESAVASVIMGANPEDEHWLTRCLLEDLVAEENGMGLSCGPSGSIVRCVARRNRGDGIRLSNNAGLCEACVAEDNDGDGIACYEGAVVVRCSIIANDGAGIRCGNSGHVILDCNIQRNGQGGVFGSGTVIRGCDIRGNSGYGVSVVFTCFVERCNIVENPGVRVLGSPVGGDGGSRIQDNNVCRNQIGISLTSNSGNFVFSNTLLGNATNLVLDVGNVAPVSTDAATAGPWHNIVR